MIHPLESRVLLSTAGDLDVSFGDRGVMSLAAPAETGIAVVVQSTGKTVIAGNTVPGQPKANNDFFLQRFNADGTVDTSFGVGGRATVDVGLSDAVVSLLLMPDDGLVAVGSTSSPTLQAIVARFDANGHLAPTFAGGGLLVSALSHGVVESSLRPAAATLLPDGSIAVTGAGAYSDRGDQTLVQVINSDGTFPLPRVVYGLSGTDDRGLDIAAQANGKYVAVATDFGGYVTVVGTPSNLRPPLRPSPPFAGITVGPGGKIVVAGLDMSDRLTVVRYNADGTPDGTFGSGGVAVIAGTANSFPNTAVYDVDTQADGSVVVTGAFSGGRSIVRLTPGGALDASFATGGAYVPPAYPAGTISLTDVFVLPDGRLAATGTVFGRTVTVRLTANGVPEAAFDGDGVVVADFAGALPQVRKVVAQPDGGYLVAGTAIGPAGSQDLFVYRFKNDGSPDGAFGTAGRAFVDFDGRADALADVALAPGGGIDLSGQTVAGPTVPTAAGADAVLARLTPGGVLDTGFAGTGKVRRDFYGFYDGFGALAVQSTGAVVASAVALTGAASSSSTSVVVRYTPAGVADSSFGSAGVVALPAGDGVADVIIVRPTAGDDRVLLTTTRIVSGGAALSVRRYTAAGAPDPTLGGGSGALATDIPVPVGSRADLVALPDGKFLVAGSTTGGRGFVARFWPDGFQDTSYANGGTYLSPAGAGRGIADPVLDSSGNLVVSSGTWRVTRLTPAGAPDPSFGAGGSVYNSVGSNDLPDFPTILAVLSTGDVVEASGQLVLRLVAGTPGPRAPEAPSGLTLTPTTDLTTTLRWFDYSNNETSFALERSPDGVTWTTLATLPANPFTNLSYTDATFSGSLSFSYRVRAANESGSSPASNVVSRGTTYLPIQGTDGNDSIRLQLDPSGQFLRVFQDGVNVSAVVPVASYSQIVASTRMGVDVLTLDLTNGNPIPAGGLVYEPHTPRSLETVHPYTHTLAVLGTGTEVAVYRPVFTPEPDPYFRDAFNWYGHYGVSEYTVAGRTVTAFSSDFAVTDFGRFDYNPGFVRDAAASVDVRATAAGTTRVSGSLPRFFGNRFVSFPSALTTLRNTPVGVYFVAGGVSIVGDVPGARPVPVTVHGSGGIGVSVPVTLALAPGTSNRLVTSPGANVLLAGGVMSLSEMELDGGSVTLSDTTTVGVGALSINTAKGSVLDIGRGAMIVNGNTTPAATVMGFVRSAFNRGRWNGPGLTSSAARADATASTAVSVADNSVLHRSTFSGVPVGDTSLLIGYAPYGDANADGSVDADDLAVIVLASSMGKTSWSAGDFNYDTSAHDPDDMMLRRLGAIYHGRPTSAAATTEASPLTERMSVAASVLSREDPLAEL
jgi:uncharacterized delta-60 repeat protein